MSEPTKIVYLAAPEKILSEGQLRETFAQYSSGDAIIVAFRQILQQRFAQAAIDAADAKLSEREAGHAGGRIQELTELTTEFTGYLQAANGDRKTRNSARNKQTQS